MRDITDITSPRPDDSESVTLLIRVDPPFQRKMKKMASWVMMIQRRRPMGTMRSVALVAIARVRE